MFKLNTQLSIMGVVGSMATISAEEAVSIVAEFRKLVADVATFEGMRSEYCMPIPSVEEVCKIIATVDNAATPIEEAVASASEIAWTVTLYILAAKASKYGYDESLRHCAATYADIMRNTTQTWQSTCITALLSHRKDELDSFIRQLHVENIVQQLIYRLDGVLMEIVGDAQVESDSAAIIIAPSSSAIH